MKVSVIVPAHDEARLISGCLEAVLASETKDHATELIVVANGCADNTAEIARNHQAVAEAQGWDLKVIETAEGGKLGALQLGDDAASGDVCIYLDADVLLSPKLAAALAEALQGAAPRYGGGSPILARSNSAVSRAFGRYWQSLPYVTDDVPGFGVFAMNSAGRARWTKWPDIISDDTFARLHFAPSERVRVRPTYTWPLVEGFGNLVRVRRRQNLGVEEVHRRYPDLARNDNAHWPALSTIARCALRQPFGFLVYSSVAIAVKTPLFSSASRWVRGR